MAHLAPEASGQFGLKHCDRCCQRVMCQVTRRPACDVGALSLSRRFAATPAVALHLIDPRALAGRSCHPVRVSTGLVSDGAAQRRPPRPPLKNQGHVPTRPFATHYGTNPYRGPQALVCVRAFLRSPIPWISARSHSAALFACDTVLGQPLCQLCILLLPHKGPKGGPRYRYPLRSQVQVGNGELYSGFYATEQLAALIWM